MVVWKILEHLLMFFLVFGVSQSSIYSKDCELTTTSDSEIGLVRRHLLQKVEVVNLLLSNNVTFFSVADENRVLSTSWSLMRRQRSFGATVLFRDSLITPLWILTTQSVDIALSIGPQSQRCVYDARNYEASLPSLLLKNLTNTHDYSLCYVNQPADVFQCCSLDQHLNIVCREEGPLSGANVLVALLVLTKVFAILFFAAVIPAWMYQTRHGYIEYVHVLKAPLEIEIRKTLRPPPQVLRADANILGSTSSQYIQTNKYLKQDHIEKLSVIAEDLELGVTQTFKLHAIWLKVNPNRLLSENSIPVRVFHFLYRRLMECKCYMQGIKRKHTKEKDAESNIKHISLHDCCSRRICFHNTWQTFFRECVRILLFFVVSLLPGMVYIVIGHTDKFPFRANSLSYHRFTFYGVFRQCNAISLYSMCYAFWFIPFILYSCMSLKSNPVFKMRAISLLRKTVRAMKTPADIGWSWSMSFLVRPCTHRLVNKTSTVSTILSVILRTTCMASTVLVFIFYNLPTLNLYCRMLWTLLHQLYLSLRNKVDTKHRSDVSILIKTQKFSEERKLKNSLNLPENEKANDHGHDYEILLTDKYERIQWVLMCTIWVFYLIFALFPFIDVIILITDMILNLLISIILGIRVTFLIILTMFSLVIYHHLFFKPITNVFHKFNVELQKYLKEQYTKKLLNTIASNREGILGNNAIQVIPKTGGCKRCALNYTLSTKNGVPKLEAKYLVQFMDKFAHTHIARSFFFEACYMKHFACPGSVSDHLYTAFRRFTFTAIFHFFFIFILFVFGESMDLSFELRFIAMLVVTFTPFTVYWYFLGKSSDVRFPEIDVNDEGFRLCLENLLREFTQKWTITDFEITRKPILTGATIVTPRTTGLINKGDCWLSTPSREFVHVEMLGTPHDTSHLNPGDVSFLDTSRMISADDTLSVNDVSHNTSVTSYPITVELPSSIKNEKNIQNNVKGKTTVTRGTRALPVRTESYRTHRRSASDHLDTRSRHHDALIRSQPDSVSPRKPGPELPFSACVTACNDDTSSDCGPNSVDRHNDHQYETRKDILNSIKDLTDGEYLI